MLNRTNDTKRKLPLTRLQKGKRYALLVMFLGLSYSTWANVRSGAIETESILTSVAPTVVFFLTVHLISYFTPKTTFQRVLVYGGLGLVASVAFGISGFHIWEITVRNGQHWIVALFYPIIVDIPTAIATAILVQKVSTNGNTTAKDKMDEASKPVQIAPKKTTPRKATPRVRTTTKPVISEEVAV